MRYDGEIIDVNVSDQESVQMSDDEINAKYKRGEIRIVTEQARYPIKSIKGMLDGEDYKLNPEYQRRKRWDNGKKSRLIESFIMNVPLPPIFLYEYEYAKFEVMDGLQRLTSIYDFYSGKFALEGLQYWTELNNKTISELPEEIKKGIDRRYISSIVLLEETAKTEEEAEKLKQIVFERLNSGGEKLTPQETRNALYNGPFNQLCLKLSTNYKFREMWDIPQEEVGEEVLLESDSYRKMEDVELVLRFFAYRFIEEMNGLKINNFLDAYLKQANNFSNELIIKLESLFNDTIDLIYELFGADAFKPPKYEREVKTPQKLIYDPLMQSISRIVDKKSIVLSKMDEIKDNIYNDKVREDGSKVFDGRRNDQPYVIERIKFFDSFFSAIL